MSHSDNTRPVKTITSGNIEASVWRKHLKKDGRNVLRHSVQIQKQYRKRGGNYENTNLYFPNELPKLILVVQEAFKFVTLRASKDAEKSA